MDVSRDVTEYWKIYLAVGAVILTLLWPWLKSQRKLARGVLIALTVLSTFNYMRWGLKSTFDRIDTYDLVHYYLNAKYFDELGYLDLYPAIILVDHENGGPLFDEGDRYLAQLPDEGHVGRPIGHALARGRQVKAERFTDARWQAFSHDYLYLLHETWLGSKAKRGTSLHKEGSLLYRQMIQDHGFNGTPVWTMLAEPITHVVPVERVKWLGQLDVLLLLAGLGLVGWAYGLDTALFTGLWLGLCYSLRWPTVSWAFLRYDWVFGLMAATALLKRGYPFVSGIFAAYAATLRFFPAMWMWGPLSKGLAGLTRKHVHKQLLVLAAGFLVGGAVLQGAATLWLGPHAVTEHFENMMDHNRAEQLSSRRIGMALALVYPDPQSDDNLLQPKILTPKIKDRIADQQNVRYALALAFMVLMGWALRRSDDDEAYGFGFLPFFLLTTASYYYYVARVTLVIVHAGRLDKPRHVVGLASLFGLEMLTNYTQTNYSAHRFTQLGTLAWGLVLYALIQCAWLIWEARQADAPPEKS